MNYNAILNKIKFGINAFTNSFYDPTVLAIESSSKCQADCLMCNRDKLKREQKDMDFELFKKIIKQAKILKVPIFQLSYYGEPLLDPNLGNKIKYLRKLIPGAAIVLNTNADLLTIELIKIFADNGLTELRISIDGNNAKEYEHIRKNLKYDNLIKNLELLKTYRDKVDSKLNIVIWAVSLQENRINKEEFRDFWRKYVDQVFIKHENKIIKQMHEPIWQKITPCFRMFGYLVIYSNGEVTMCDSDWYGVNIIGDIKNTSLKKIWFSNKLIWFRFLHSMGLKKAIGICSNCAYRPLSNVIQNKEFLNYNYK